MIYVIGNFRNITDLKKLESKTSFVFINKTEYIDSLEDGYYDISLQFKFKLIKQKNMSCHFINKLDSNNMIFSSRRKITILQNKNFADKNLDRNKLKKCYDIIDNYMIPDLAKIVLGYNYKEDIFDIVFPK